jgi:serine/threonine protein kinase
MPWPLGSEFQTILQNPKIAFRDPFLRSCTIERNALGQPRAWAGSFAVVYKGIDATGAPLAIRVFSTESPHRRGRYDQIGEYLAPRRLPCLVSFEYREEEIRSLSDGKRYPIVLMDWVEGETLFQWVGNQCRRGDAAALVGVARQWPTVVAELSREQIAHGDLQHANIMVTPKGKLKLVDYDGMCVPALLGANCLEVGTPPYQHPQRNSSARLSLRLDDFSALVIHAALQALAADSALWGKYVEQTHSDKLLFREDDFLFPQKSALRRELLKSAEPNVRYVTERLFAAAAGQMDDVPRLDEIIASCKFSVSTATDGLVSRQRAPNKQDAAARSDGRRHDRRPPANVARHPSVKPAGQLRGAPMPKLPGYEMIAEIGKGPCGTVYIARSAATGQQVAVKIMPITATAAEIVRRRFLLDMDRVALAANPHVVRPVERGTVGQSFYFVTEYCDGGNVADWMEAGGGKLLPSDLRSVMQQCLDGLKQAHLHRLVHGNINPRNILFATQRVPGARPTVVTTITETIVKISDFLLTALFERKFSSQSNRSLDPRNAGFMPRERLTSEHGLTSKSDLWSLAAVIYYALSGHYPWDFGGRDPRDVIVGEEPVPILQRGIVVPTSVGNVIDRALRLNPAHRFQSASEMKSAWDSAF